MKRIYLLAILYTCIHFSLFAQERARIGGWRYYLPFKDVIYTTQSDDKIFLSFESGVVSYDKADSDITYITKLNQLSDFNCRTIGWNTSQQALIVTYQNGNIDLLRPDGTTNLPNIKNSPNIVGGRQINHIYNTADAAFLSADYGISKLDLVREEFSFTTFTNTKVNAFIEFQNQYYAATEEGVYSVNSSLPILEDFTSWGLLGMSKGMPGDYQSYAFEVNNDQLFISTDMGLYGWDGDTATLRLPAVGNKVPQALGNSKDGRLFVFTGCVGDPDCNPGLFKLDAQGQVETVRADAPCYGRPTNFIEDENGWLWLGNRFGEIRRINTNGDCDNLSLNSPRDDKAYRITLDKNRVYVAAGAVAASEQYSWYFNGIYVREENGDWEEINEFVYPIMDFSWDYTDVAIDPADGTEYISTYSRGVYEKKGDEITLFDKDNSSMGEVIGDRLRTRVTDLEFDESGNLWVANFGALEPLSVLTSEKEWFSFESSVQSRDMMGVKVDLQGNKWFFFARGNTPLVVFNEGDDYANISDDQYRAFSSANSVLPSNDVLSMAVDLNGSVWVGTDDGVIVFDRCGDVFDDGCVGDRRIVEVDGIAAFLLETERVVAIAVDGANRKWFGTTNGVFVQSADGIEQIFHFTAENSPLPNNGITDISIRKETGEVFIGTEDGLVSFQSQAVSGSVINSANTTVYPNPVRPDYDGPIAIKGLARDANVKITDTQGRLVDEFRATGGQAIWDGRDYNGRRVSSGVYLVFSTADRNLTNPDAVIAKIVVIGQ